MSGGNPFDDVPDGLTFRVSGFTGLDVFYSFLLSEKRHARSIARRWKRGPGHFIQMPSGRMYRILDGNDVAEAVAHHPV